MQQEPSLQVSHTTTAMSVQHPSRGVAVRLDDHRDLHAVAQGIVDLLQHALDQQAPPATRANRIELGLSRRKADHLLRHAPNLSCTRAPLSNTCIGALASNRVPAPIAIRPHNDRGRLVLVEPRTAYLTRT